MTESARAAVTLGLRVVWSATGAVDEILRSMIGQADAIPSLAAADADLVLTFETATRPRAYAAPSGSVWSFYQDRIAAYAGPTAFSFQDDASEIVVPLDGGPVVGTIHPRSEADGRSLRLMLDLALTMALRARGIFHLHAGGVVRDDTCVLLAGESGAGKTSSTLALVEAGWSYLSDDSIFLLADSGSPRAFVSAQRRAFHVTAATLEAHPALASLATQSVTEPTKVRVEVERAFPGRFREAAPSPAVLLFPVVAGGPTTSAVSLADAHAMGNLLMASAMLSVPGTPHTARHLDVLRSLVEAARCYELRLGADFLRSPSRAVREVVEPLVGRARASGEV